MMAGLFADPETAMWIAASILIVAASLAGLGLWSCILGKALREERRQAAHMSVTMLMILSTGFIFGLVLLRVGLAGPAGEQRILHAYRGVFCAGSAVNLAAAIYFLSQFVSRFLGRKSGPETHA